MEMKTFFYHRSDSASEKGRDIKPHKIDSNILNKAITFHPMKRPQNMELFSWRMRSKELNNLLSMTWTLNSAKNKIQMRNISPMPTGTYLDSFKFSEEPWSLVDHNNVHTVGVREPRYTVPVQLKEAFKQIFKSMNLKFNRRQLGNKLTDLHYIYVNENLQNGMSYIIGRRQKFKRKKGMLNAPQLLYVQQPLLEPLIKVVSQEDFSLTTGRKPFS
jgi:hypothetical protein